MKKEKQKTFLQAECYKTNDNHRSEQQGKRLKYKLYIL